LLPPFLEPSATQSILINIVDKNDRVPATFWGFSYLYCYKNHPYLWITPQAQIHRRARASARS
jgi:hypothetical protein